MQVGFYRLFHNIAINRIVYLKKNRFCKVSLFCMPIKKSTEPIQEQAFY